MMRKPNITAGEWELLEEGDIENGELYLVNSSGELAVHDSFHRANAKAISAVPEMIDALIEVHELIIFELKFENEINRKNTLNHKKEKVEQALTKAGVQL